MRPSPGCIYNLSSPASLATLCLRLWLLSLCLLFLGSHPHSARFSRLHVRSGLTCLLNCLWCVLRAGMFFHLQTPSTCKTCVPHAIHRFFLSDHTKWNNSRAIKMPIVKYPYLPLSEQITSILRIPGIKALLDEWCKKPRKTGEYTDIFNSNICRNRLRALDGSLFFSNLPHENNGPHGELRIGVNLGLDWYVCRTFFDCT
jgi:hypothetical protein